ncbi:hypothetical protein [Paracraurococcus lichenis]|uniref:Uncharacterized protein n=1 Tax=Paracraurococcus lichenis TaxID=3064888 RepID=A0ABT9E3D1_9PROT|nr:hypothetical protein [Paracraurococcus sp. LOR1-02]MDO9710663.1 hypothetical protein [Paracraurococcus sp. LOR1-02]
MPLLLALAACGPSALAVVGISLVTVPLQVGRRTYAGGNFVAAEPGRRAPPFIAESTNLEFGDYGRVPLALGWVADTPARRAALEALTRRLEAHGWRRDGSTGPWYGTRFTR